MDAQPLHGLAGAQIEPQEPTAYREQLLAIKSSCIRMVSPKLKSARLCDIIVIHIFAVAKISVSCSSESEVGHPLPSTTITLCWWSGGRDWLS